MAGGHGAPRGEIRIGGTRVGRHYRFSVTDNGPGVPEDALPRLFEPCCISPTRRRSAATSR
ncbi:ATP-binding protein [Burkholderia contaminans]|uniref:ATP-binding protein n=1 Tax=Burkholderia contaminans TaxID=488447 RepID=UPI00214FAF55|nr:ATP-binding protein [Burkholderia contaminans]UUX40472.1 ATP-binding protein [Burkholderia contaminans]